MPLADSVAQPELQLVAQSHLEAAHSQAAGTELSGGTKTISEVLDHILVERADSLGLSRSQARS